MTMTRGHKLVAFQCTRNPVEYTSHDPTSLQCLENHNLLYQGQFCHHSHNKSMVIFIRPRAFIC
uniref:Uncharacterized protein n=1 Tax=Arundo donax TaxID=35708 RepID=A0A0A9GDD1_ARUDO